MLNKKWKKVGKWFSSLAIITMLLYAPSAYGDTVFDEVQKVYNIVKSLPEMKNWVSESLRYDGEVIRLGHIKSKTDLIDDIMSKTNYLTDIRTSLFEGGQPIRIAYMKNQLEDLFEFANTSLKYGGEVVRLGDIQLGVLDIREWANQSLRYKGEVVRLGDILTQVDKIPAMVSDIDVITSGVVDLSGQLPGMVSGVADIAAQLPAMAEGVVDITGQLPGMASGVADIAADLSTNLPNMVNGITTLVDNLADLPQLAEDLFGVADACDAKHLEAVKTKYVNFFVDLQVTLIDLEVILAALDPELTLSCALPVDQLEKLSVTLADLDIELFAPQILFSVLCKIDAFIDIPCVFQPTINTIKNIQIELTNPAGAGPAAVTASGFTQGCYVHPTASELLQSKVTLATLTAAEGLVPEEFVHLKTAVTIPKTIVEMAVSIFEALDERNASCIDINYKNTVVSNLEVEIPQRIVEAQTAIVDNDDMNTATILSLNDENQIEEHLVNGNKPIQLFIPVAMGGKLEQVRTLIEMRIGQLSSLQFDTTAAQSFLDNGDTSFAAADYSVAYDNYQTAYQELMKLAPSPAGNSGSAAGNGNGKP